MPTRKAGAQRNSQSPAIEEAPCRRSSPGKFPVATSNGTGSIIMASKNVCARTPAMRKSFFSTLIAGKLPLPKLAFRLVATLRGIVFTTPTLRKPLLRQPIEKIHGLNRLAWFPEGGEPALVDVHNAARAVERCQCPVHRQPECPVVAPHHEPVGLIGKQEVRQSETFRVLRRQREPDQDAAVGSEGIGFVPLDNCNPLRMILDADHLNVNELLLEKLVQSFLGGGAGDDRNALAGQAV